ncbi:tRNA-(MS[2]IO[6]A)-hydroxylase MiaE-like protein [Nonomuraea polychroma]|uniref:tRNA-(MS[2]IO[6]A)-hydroxylase MiaE-like protein n=2 Tax=Nonomuraea polychroma TaxID=46176 RepID=A0A438MFH0_9ACTN|nr:tRNA-(MS[2]IO[6]A)-hydroxylase MiaE-like protein [Nonomuraea polychroma]
MFPKIHQAPRSTLPLMKESPGVVDLLGLLAYAELSAYARMTEDATTLAPSLADRMALSELAVTEYAHFRLLRDRLAELGADPAEAMSPYVAALDAWHAQTRPADWLQALVKTYVGDGIAHDFYREGARHLDPSIADLVDEVLVDEGRSQFAVERVRAGIEADPKAAARLALWARRLVGEALSQAQQVAAARPELALLLVEAGGGQADISRLFAKLTEEHGKRMAAMGL